MEKRPCLNRFSNTARDGDQRFHDNVTAFDALHRQPDFSKKSAGIPRLTGAAAILNSRRFKPRRTDSWRKTRKSQ
jgi:hypothetical protein